MLRASDHETRFLRVGGVIVLVRDVGVRFRQLHGNHLPALRRMTDILKLDDVGVHIRKVPDEFLNLAQRVVDRVVRRVSRGADIPMSLVCVVAGKWVFYARLPCFKWARRANAYAIRLKTRDGRC